MQTFGWDTAFVVKEDSINALLRANADKTVLGFDTVLPGSPGSRLHGTFAPWQLTDGGSIDIVHLKLAIASGTLEHGGKSYDLAGLTLVVATYLHWLEYGNDTGRDLRFDYGKVGEPGQPPARGELSVIALRDPGEVLPPDLNALSGYALGAYLVGHADQVRFVFASVNLVPPANNSWLAPKKNAYGYFQRAGGTESFLAIFSVTTDRDISGLQRTVDPAAFPAGTNATFVISDELYLTNVIAPSLGRALHGAPAQAFSYDKDAGVLRNNQRLRTRTVRSGAIDYHPYIDQLEIRSGTNALQGRYKGRCDMKAGIRMSYQIAANNGSRYDPGSGALVFAADPRPKESHKCDIPWYWFAGGLIVTAIVEICVKIIGDDIANQISDDNRERLAFGRYPPSSILWGGSGAFAVANVGIDGAMYLQGNIAAAAAPRAKPRVQESAQPEGAPA